MTKTITDPHLLSVLEMDAASLVAAYPPRWRHAHKQLVASLSCPPNRPHAGRVRVTRWQAGEVAGDVPTVMPELESHCDLFDYRSDGGGVHWYLNFADRRLFVAYGGGLMAQDELQVAEHPALASVAEAMAALPDHEPLTVDSDGIPTPVLIRGVQRRCVIDTSPDLSDGRIYGLYGNRFQLAEPTAVQAATTVLEPPTVSNILAMEAPTGYRGRYSEAQIRFVLRTAVAGFSAAANESGDHHPLVIHTGFWGCGAYGGNRELMALLQIVAARIANVGRLVFHTFDEAGMSCYRAAEERAVKLGDLRTLTEIVDAVLARGYEWGVSDGN